MMNTVILVGEIASVPIFKRTDKGVALYRFRLATVGHYGVGEAAIQHKEWHNIVAWGHLAEAYKEQFVEGQVVYVEGSIRSSRWTDSNGNEQRGIDIKARNVVSLDVSQHKVASAKSSSQLPF